MRETAPRPSAARIAAVLAEILGRRYNSKLQVRPVPAGPDTKGRKQA